VSQDRVQWQVLVKTVTKLVVSWTVGNFLISWATISFSRTLLHGFCQSVCLMFTSGRHTEAPCHEDVYGMWRWSSTHLHSWYRSKVGQFNSGMHNSWTIFFYSLTEKECNTTLSQVTQLLNVQDLKDPPLMWKDWLYNM